MTDISNLPEEEIFSDELGWLVDIPLFIDQKRVSQLYDLTVQPIFHEHQRNPVEEINRILEGESDRVAGGVEAGVEGGSMLSMIASGKLKGWIEGEYTKSEEDEETTRYQLTQTPQRQLAQIAIQYLLAGRDGDEESKRNYHYIKDPSLNNPDYKIESNELAEWLQCSAPSEPRDLVILELPGVKDVDDGSSDQVPTKFVPTAAEFENGAVVQLYQKFEQSYEKPPRYPERDKRWDEMGPYYENIHQGHPLADEDRGENELIGDAIHPARDYYWKWFEGKFNGKKATKIVEEACREHGDIRWIDFRLPLNKSGYTLHLHIQPREEYNTGTFAYNFIKRGFKHGLLLVGTIKSEPDMDVLAIYER